MEEQRDRGTEQFLDSCSKVTARLIESIFQTAQLAGANTPEIRELFQHWLDFLSLDILRTLEKDAEIDVNKEAQRIGITPSSLLTLLVSLHRQGKICISSVKALRDNAANRELCHCLIEKVKEE
jgi:predicted transcriptional regulator